MKCIVDYLGPILGALSSLATLFVAWAEFSDYRKAQLTVKFAPPAPDLETSQIRKLRLVVENHGRGIAKKVNVESLTPSFCFGYSETGKNTYCFDSIGVEDFDSINCLDKCGDILSQQYDFVFKWRGFLFHKYRLKKTIFWEMFSNDYPELPELDSYAPSAEDIMNT